MGNPYLALVGCLRVRFVVRLLNPSDTRVDHRIDRIKERFHTVKGVEDRVPGAADGALCAAGNHEPRAHELRDRNAL